MKLALQGLKEVSIFHKLGAFQVQHSLSVVGLLQIVRFTVVEICSKSLGFILDVGFIINMVGMSPHAPWTDIALLASWQRSPNLYPKFQAPSKCPQNGLPGTPDY